MGVVFDHGRPEEAEQGGPIFAVDAIADGYRLLFGRPGPDLSRVSPGDFVWISSDPKVTRAGEKAAEAGRTMLGRIPVDLVVRGRAGEPLVVTATTRGNRVVTTTERSTSSLATARGAGLSRETLADKLGGFGGTAFHLAEVTAELDGALHLPVSELKDIRRRIAATLDGLIVRVDRTLAEGSVLDALRSSPPTTTTPTTTTPTTTTPTTTTPTTTPSTTTPSTTTTPTTTPIVVPLCRTDAQLDAVLDAGCEEVELDWMELVGLGKAVERARKRGVRVGVATVRVQKPDEQRIDAHLAKLAPDHVLVRSWGSLAYFAALAQRPILHGDFSLNVTNSITARWVLDHGLATITAAHDLDREQLFAMIDAAAVANRVAVTIHHHIPTFHTEHCVYAHLLSKGRDFRTCGRPCERHEVALADRVGLVHPVVVDVGCRNTVFNAQAQSAASLVPALLERGVRRLRVELVRETAEQASRVVAAYRELVRGAIGPADVVKRAAVHEQFGVTRGTMRTLTVLR